jgi:hypothetical protein
MFTPAVHLTSCHCTVCSLQQSTWHPVTVQCVHSSRPLGILSLYSVFTPAVHLTSCHCTLCSLQQSTWHPVTVQYVHSTSPLDTLSLLCVNTSSTLDILSLYSVFTPVVHLASCYNGMGILSKNG